MAWSPFTCAELSARRRFKTLRLEQLGRSRRCEQGQKAPRSIGLFGRGADAAGEDDVALQFRRQPADKLDTGLIKDGREAGDDEIRLAARDRPGGTA